MTELLNFVGVWNLIGGLGTKSPRSKNFVVIKVPIQAVFVSLIIQKIYQWFVSLSVKKICPSFGGGMAPCAPPPPGSATEWDCVALTLSLPNYYHFCLSHCRRCKNNLIHTLPETTFRDFICATLLASESDKTHYSRLCLSQLYGSTTVAMVTHGQGSNWRKRGVGMKIITIPGQNFGGGKLRAKPETRAWSAREMRAKPESRA